MLARTKKRYVWMDIERDIDDPRKIPVVGGVNNRSVRSTHGTSKRNDAKTVWPKKALCL